MALGSVETSVGVHLGVRWASGLLPTRQRLVLGSTALLVGLLASTGAHATTCTGPGVSTLLPVGAGGAVSSIVSVIDTANIAFLAGTSAFVSSPPSPTRNQQGGGVWVRGIGGTVDTDNTSVVTANVVSPDSNPPVNLQGTDTCQTTTEQDFAGFQVGRDIAKLNLDGTGLNVHFGMTAGYFEADSKEKGGSFRAESMVPFAGLYAVATKGNFFADGLVRWDFFDNELTDPANGLFDQKLDARSVSLTGNVGYRINVHPNSGSKWFVEPSGGFVWSRTEVDPLNVAGTVFNQPVPGSTFPGSVTIDDIDGLLGRLSVRVGTNFSSGKMAWQPFATASVFHEFADDVKTTQKADAAAVNIPNLILEGSQTTSRIGTYGQFGLGMAGQLIDTGWIGYARVDYRTGQDIEGVSGNIGLRYQFTPGPVASSLKDGKSFHAPTPLAYNWTGFYIGGFAGMIEGEQDWTFVGVGSTTDPDYSGYLLGGTVGYNHQMGKWVIGIEGDVGGSNAEGGKACPNLFFVSCQAEVDYMATVAGRVGVVWERALFYVKGGLAIAEVGVQARQNLTAAALGAPGAFPTVEGQSKNLTGWTVGTGAEFALSKNWSAKGEWMYYDLGTSRFTPQPISFPADKADIETHGSVVRIGVNYHFNPY